VGVVDLDSLFAPQDVYVRAVLRSVLTASTVAALGLRHVVLFTACHDSPLPFPLLAAVNTSWSPCIREGPQTFLAMYRGNVGRFYDVDVSEAATSAAVQAVLGGEEEEELWVGEQHCRRAKAAQDSVRLQEGEAQEQQQPPPAGPIYIWITLCLKSALEAEQPRLLQSLLASLLLPCQADLHVHVTVNDVAAPIVRYARLLPDSMLPCEAGMVSV
jgi:hypothetical protein